jgi:hypothetical protein
MPWFKIDDGFWSHPKTLQLSDGAQALWMRAGSWSMHQLTDGYIPNYSLPILSAKKRFVDELLAVSLWIPAKDGNQFHDWDVYQPTRERVEADRRAAADRKALSREKSQHPSRVTGNEVPEGVTPTPTRPDPTRPINTSTDVEVAPQKRGSRIPEPFIVTADMRAWAQTRTPGVDVDSATEKFANYWRAKTSGATKLDWRGTWDNWLISDFERSTTNRKPTPEQRARTTLSLATDIDMRELTG